MIVYSDAYLRHDLASHPENAARLRAIMGYLREKLERLDITEPRRAEQREVCAVHSEGHYEYIRTLSEAGGGRIGMDTYVTPDSFEVALLAAGGAITAAELAMQRSYAFALVRPPGHHATQEEAMGFCLFNNIAIAARYALERGMVKRVLVLDIDVHHGNGTQDIFYSSPEVLFISLHQHPLYPGTGYVKELGEGEGRGYTVNIPLPPGADDGSYLLAMDEIALPIAEQFSPQLVLVSAGYDTAREDPLGGMLLSKRSYYEIGRRIRVLTRRAALTLEGGYSQNALAQGVYATLAGLFDLEGEEKRIDMQVNPQIKNRLEEYRRVLREYWEV
ncbi:histone deacetylase family protein [Candidatus Pyrohabitans sp.]